MGAPEGKPFAPPRVTYRAANRVIDVAETQHEQAIGQHLDDLYAEAGHWHVNTGKETIHAKRVTGRFRALKWWSSAVWLVFFLGPFLRWDGPQAATSASRPCGPTCSR